MQRIDEGLKEKFWAKYRTVWPVLLAPWPEVGLLARLGRLITFAGVVHWYVDSSLHGGGGASGLEV